MINTLESRWSAARHYNSTGVSWGDEIHRGRVSPYVTDPDSRPERQVFVNVPDYAETLHLFKLLSGSLESATSDWRRPTLRGFHPVSRRSEAVSATEDLRQRLANANDYFHRKATEVYTDKAALELLITMDQDVVLEISDFDTCESGIPLAKLTAANFSEVGAKVIFITEAGQRFIASLRQSGEI